MTESILQENELNSGRSSMPDDKVESVQTQEESLVDGIFGVQEYKLEDRPRKEFLPWHRPRKQFVRHNQWLKQIEKMVEEVMPDNNILKYLGLPGDDLLDLRYFHDNICVPKDLRLKFLGFNRSAGASEPLKAELNISIDEVIKLKNVDPTSSIIGDDICQIARDKSIAWERSHTTGPFDVINIDLCDGIGSQPTDQFQETHYNTINRLMALQARRPKPWLLLITTRTGLEHINTGVLERLRRLYHENLIQCPPFNTASVKSFSIGSEEELNASIVNEKSASDIFLISLCKWIASIASSQVPLVKVELKSVLGYKVAKESKHQDLVSIALKIIPTMATATDEVGLAVRSTIPTPAISSECSAAAKIVTRVAKFVDVDEILAKDDGLMKNMIDMSTALLTKARYDITGYDIWARS